MPRELIDLAPTSDDVSFASLLNAGTPPGADIVKAPESGPNL
jgi:membrane protein